MKKYPKLPRLGAALICMLLAVGQPASTSASGTHSWVSPHYRDHVLAGTIWTSSFKRISMSELEKKLSEAPYVLLGEIHNNPDHHRLQAQLIEKLVKSGRRPAVVLEMVPATMQPRIDQFVESGATNAAGLGRQLKWEERGWPDWVTYQPIADVALSAALPIQAGNIDRKVQRQIGKSGISALDAQTRRELRLDKPLEPVARKGLAQTLIDGHCGLLPEQMIGPMTDIQRAKDASLAQSMIENDPANGAVLIAGSGHVRHDWAVPRFIRMHRPNADIIAVAFIEVDPKQTSPENYIQAYSGLQMPYDFIYFTPRAELKDYCAELEAKFPKKKID